MGKRGSLGLGASYVHVENGPTEQLVPHGTAHDPRLLVREDLACKVQNLKHRGRCAACALPND